MKSIGLPVDRYDNLLSFSFPKGDLTTSSSPHIYTATSANQKGNFSTINPYIPALHFLIHYPRLAIIPHFYHHPNPQHYLSFSASSISTLLPTSTPPPTSFFYISHLFLPLMPPLHIGAILQFLQWHRAPPDFFPSPLQRNCCS